MNIDRGMQAMLPPELLDEDLCTARVRGKPMLGGVVRDPSVRQVLERAAAEDEDDRKAAERARKTGAIGKSASALRRENARLRPAERARAEDAALVYRAHAYYTGPRVRSEGQLVSVALAGEPIVQGWATDYLLVEDIDKGKAALITVRLRPVGGTCASCWGTHRALEVWRIVSCKPGAELGVLKRLAKAVSAQMEDGSIELHGCYTNDRTRMVNALDMRYTGVYGEYVLCVPRPARRPRIAT